MKTRTFALAALLLMLPLAGCTQSPDTQTTPTVTPTSSTPTPTGSPSPSPTPVVPTPDVPIVGIDFSDDFEGASIGGIPVGWSVVHGNWSVVANESAPSGGHTLLSDTTELPETWILADAAGAWGDLNASMMFSVHSGESGQAGGIIFRYADEENYYVVRYNHNELKWNLFRTIEGKRQKYAGTNESETDFHGGLDTWTPLKVEANGTHIAVYSGDLKVIDHMEDAANAPKAGKVGLWTRWDSKTEFDDFRVTSL